VAGAQTCVLLPDRDPPVSGLLKFGQAVEKLPEQRRDTWQFRAIPFPDITPIQRPSAPIPWALSPQANPWPLLGADDDMLVDWLASGVAVDLLADDGSSDGVVAMDVEAASRSASGSAD